MDTEKTDQELFLELLNRRGIDNSEFDYPGKVEGNIAIDVNDFPSHWGLAGALWEFDSEGTLKSIKHYE